MNPLLEQARQHHVDGRLSQAEEIYRGILASNSGDSQAVYLLGVLCHQTRRPVEAVYLLRRAAEANPQIPECHYYLGLAQGTAGNGEEAIAAFNHAIALRPDYAAAHNSLGNELSTRGDLDRAIASLHRAVELRPEVGGYWSNLGIVLRSNRQWDEAIAAFHRAIAVQPNYAEGHGNLGLALFQNEEFSRAIDSYQKSIALKPDFAEAHDNLGTVLREACEMETAIESYGRAVALAPDQAEFLGNLAFARLYQPDRKLAEDVGDLRRWDADHARPLGLDAPAYSNDRDAHRRLRVGYVSADFRRHSVSYFLKGWFSYHDPAHVEIFCYSNIEKSDEITEELKKSARHWRDVSAISDAALADLIRQDKIDLLIDLAGHTARNRLLAFARKPAPVQISYLGYPATTGLEAMTYRLTDGYADPIGSTEYLHTEKLVRLPRTFLCYSPLPDAPMVSAPPALNRGYVTFGSFNYLAKISSVNLRMWSEILARVPSSRLMLKGGAFSDSAIRKSLVDKFVSFGISADRLDLRGKTPDPASHLRMYENMDIALDTYPYNGTTTTCEAIWMGVPVITLAGKTHVSRVGVSLLTNSGFSDLIAETEEDYIDKAVALAGDIPQLAERRAVQREGMSRSPLMDAKTFARELEFVFRELWQRWLATDFPRG